MPKKRNVNERVTHAEKVARITAYLENHVDKGGGRLTLQQICDGCGIVNNGHSGTAINAVCEQFSQWIVVHHIEIPVGGRVRYELEVRV